MHAHPKKETARISILPDPPPGSRAPTVNMTKTQPLIKAPLAPAPHVPVTVAPTGAISGAIDAVPRALLWALLGISALIFLIQLWNYFSV